MTMNQDHDLVAYLARAFATPAERLENFKHVQPETRAAVERAFRVRMDFGLWDELDPVANRIIDLAAAQNSLTAAINQDEETWNGGGEIAKAAVARIRAIVELIDALTEAVDERIAGAAELNQDALSEFGSALEAAVARFHNNVIADRQGGQQGPQGGVVIPTR